MRANEIGFGWNFCVLQKTSCVYLISPAVLFQLSCVRFLCCIARNSHALPLNVVCAPLPHVRNNVISFADFFLPYNSTVNHLLFGCATLSSLACDGTMRMENSSATQREGTRKERHDRRTYSAQLASPYHNTLQHHCSHRFHAVHKI